MLQHFRDAQSDLSYLPTAGDVFHQQPFHQANAVSEMADLVAQRLLEAIPPGDTPPLAYVSATDTANAVFQQRNSALAAREAALLTQMTNMMALMRNGAAATSSVSHPRDTRQPGSRSSRSNARSSHRGSRRPTSAPRPLFP